MTSQERDGRLTRWADDPTSETRVVEYDLDRGRTAKHLARPEILDARLVGVAGNEAIPVTVELRDDQPVRIRPRGASQWQSPQLREPRQQAVTAATVGDAVAGEGFVNPYTFVPALPRGHVTGDLGDASKLGGAGPLAGHDRWHPDRWTGTLRLKITTATPLLVTDPARVGERDGHQTLPVRVDEHGRPVLAATSVKGMLRAAYEAITNSRLGVFASHDRRLGLRLPSSSGADVVPVRVERAGGRLRARLYLGTASKPAGAPATGAGRAAPEPMYAAWVPCYPASERPPLLKGSGLDHWHGKQVAAELALYEKTAGTKRFRFWRVVKLAHTVPDLKTAPKANATAHAGWTLQPGPPLQVDGVLCITGQNIGNKHDERLFFNPLQALVDISDPVRAAWADLLRDYLGQLAERSRTANAAKPETLSRHLRGRDVELRDGTLCYAKVTGSGANLAITALYPVMISRELHPLPPSELLDASLRPARAEGELSPADRVFGWANADGEGARRGMVRLGPITCTTPAGAAVKPLPGTLPLAILSSPKPNQGRFYVGGRDGEPASRNDSKADAGYQNAGRQALRGRKVYPHHDGLPEGYWEPDPADRVGDRYREYRRPKDPTTGVDTDKQNRSIHGWVPPKTVFTCTLRVTNLSTVELGALLWLLRLPDGCYHRLGGAKPLGLGSVRVDLDGGELLNGTQWASRYRTLLAPPTPAPIEQVVGEAKGAFEHEVAEVYGRGGDPRSVPFIQAFLAAARGSAIPVHYPRLTPAPDPSGENFRWFVTNERIKDEVVVNGYSLPSAAAEQLATLPFLQPERKAAASRARRPPGHARTRDRAADSNHT